VPEEIRGLVGEPLDGLAAVGLGGIRTHQAVDRLALETNDDGVPINDPLDH
jgi:hypothetical protein